MRSVLVLPLALFVACASPDAPVSNPDATAEPMPPVANPPMGGPEAAAGDPGVPLAEILDESVEARALRERLAEPRRVETEAVVNRHVEGQTDTLRTLHYDGLALEFYEVPDGPVFLQEVAVTGEGYETAEGLGVGSTREEVEAVYPSATSAEGDTVTYERYDSPEDPTPGTLVVRYEGGRAAALTWAFYVD